MTKVTIEIPDELMSRLENTGYSVQNIVVQALQRYFETVESAGEISKSQTWQLCGSLTVANPEPEYILRRDEQGQEITNYAENVDDVLY